MARKRCFVIIPFEKAFGEVFEKIRGALEDLGVECRRGDHHRFPGVVMEQIVKEIRDSHLVIADLTNRNSNVFFEVGIAQTVLGPARTILLSQRSEDVPFDLRAQRYIEYTHSIDGLLELRRELRTWIANAMEENFPETDDVIFGKEYRTKQIIDAAGRIARVWLDGSVSEQDRVIRSYASVSSIGISEHEFPETPADEAYQQLLNEERHSLLKLIEHKAHFKLMLRPPTERRPGIDWRRLALRLNRMILLLSGQSDSKDPGRQNLDRQVAANCTVTISMVPEANTLVLGDRIAFEVFRRSSERGFDGTYWTTKRDEVSSLVEQFDRKFDQASRQCVGRPGAHQPIIKHLRDVLDSYRASCGSDWDESILPPNQMGAV